MSCGYWGGDEEEVMDVLLFSVHSSKDGFTDEPKPVGQFLKGIKDGGVSIETCAKGKVTVPHKRLMNELMDVSEV